MWVRDSCLHMLSLFRICISILHSRFHVLYCKYFHTWHASFLCAISPFGLIWTRVRTGWQSFSCAWNKLRMLFTTKLSARINLLTAQHRSSFNSWQFQLAKNSLLLWSTDWTTGVRSPEEAKDFPLASVSWPALRLTYPLSNEYRGSFLRG
jgi:hypothetical protein